jgi:hypothetical protein
LKASTAAELLPIKMRWIGGIETPVTPQHFLTYRDEQASAADGTYWIRRIPRPILILRDEADGVVLPFEPYVLLSAARADGSLVPEHKVRAAAQQTAAEQGRPCLHRQHGGAERRRGGLAGGAAAMTVRSTLSGARLIV